MMICSLTGCTEDEAKTVYNETHDTVEAVDRLLAKTVVVTSALPHKRKREDITPDEIEIEKIRNQMEVFDVEMDKKLPTGGRPAASKSDVMPSHHEETVQQNNCLPEYQPSLIQ